MNDNASGTHPDGEALEAERLPNASEVDIDDDSDDDDTFIDELEDSQMGGTERLGGTR